MRYSVNGLVLLLLLGTSGFAESTGQGDVQKTEVVVPFDGEKYNILLYSPDDDGAAASYPLIIVVSDIGGKLVRFVRATEFSKMAGSRHFVVAYLQPDENNHWYEWLNADAQNAPVVANLFRSVIKKVSSLKNIRSKNIYLAGFSGGGMIVLAGMCELSNEVAAFGVVAASLPVNWQSNCKMGRSVPAIIIASRDDPELPWDGGNFRLSPVDNRTVAALSITDTVNIWRSNNKCDPRPSLEPYANLDPTDRTTVTKMIYDFQCRDAANVILYAITGGGHSWPGSIVKLRGDGAISQDIRASDTIWEFVSQYQLKR